MCCIVAVTSISWFIQHTHCILVTCPLNIQSVCLSKRSVAEWGWGRWCWFQTSERSMHAISFTHRPSSAFSFFCGSLAHSFTCTLSTQMDCWLSVLQRRNTVRLLLMGISRGYCSGTCQALSDLPSCPEVWELFTLSSSFLLTFS